VVLGPIRRLLKAETRLPKLRFSGHFIERVQYLPNNCVGYRPDAARDGLRNLSSDMIPGRDRPPRIRFWVWGEEIPPRPSVRLLHLPSRCRIAVLCQPMSPMGCVAACLLHQHVLRMKPETRFTMRLPCELRDALAAAAEAERRTVANMVRVLIADALAARVLLANRPAE
jgi:CopG-like RHH_1 or ribbon-helix-helix domain, RHH_5